MTDGAEKPNILFILMDDMGWKDLACTGSEFYETPNIDRLRAEGMKFTNAYASCPVCSPTRASVMTGRYPARIGLTNFIAGVETGKLISAPYIKHLPLENKTVAGALRDGGYSTWHVGKWHLGPEKYWPQHQGFDVNVAGGHHGHPHNGYFSPWHLDSIEDGPEGEYLTDRLTDEVINLIRTKDHKPFFLNLCYYSVHTPIQAKEDDIAYFEEKALRMGLDKKEALIEGEPYPCDHKKHLRVVRRVIQSDPVYAAMVKAVDDNVGRILQTLEETGELDNTLIVFTSDNGGLSTAEGSPTSNLPLAEGKGWMYEGGTREPLLIRWPGRVAAGSTCDVPVTSTDFYPTFLQAADLDLIPEQHCDGVSLMPLLEGSGSLDREAIFWHYPHYGNQGGTPGCSVRYGDWKLIEFFEDGRLELYNLHEDESEDRDVSGEHPEMTAKLAQLLADWREEVSANMPTPNPDYVPPSLD